MRHEVALVVEVGGQEVMRALVRGIHERVGAVGVADAGDGMVEEGHRNFRIALLADVDEDGIGVDSREAQHGGEKGRLVAADAVAVVKGHRDVVRLVAGGFGLGRDAHVADVLRDPGEEGADDGGLGIGSVGGSLGGGFVCDLRHERLHFRRRRIETRLAESPVPLGEGLPVFGRAEKETLRDRVEGGHFRLGEGLRDVADLPDVERAARL